ncbi:hypothetical protein [Ornithinibacillus halotolerans]|uniref:Uncharacterized protein n=1 Tax=Ornithinibacillus halotolerans TaxID=1274357 RepID=A0A916S9H1_9BACI|nr:hypothetical protein [Ornithinibacillus halotolerans]GGA90693.1 hypothetical protein GCM10008025_36520 [Ornithinibacillus halotolerans]
MSTNVTTIVAIISIILWIAVSIELSRTPKNKRKLITLMSVGFLSTLILTVSIFRTILLLNNVGLIMVKMVQGLKAD